MSQSTTETDPFYASLNRLEAMFDVDLMEGGDAVRGPLAKGFFFQPTAEYLGMRTTAGLPAPENGEALLDRTLLFNLMDEAPTVQQVLGSVREHTKLGPYAADLEDALRQRLEQAGLQDADVMAGRWASIALEAAQPVIDELVPQFREWEDGWIEVTKRAPEGLRGWHHDTTLRLEGWPLALSFTPQGDLAVLSTNRGQLSSRYSALQLEMYQGARSYRATINARTENEPAKIEQLCQWRNIGLDQEGLLYVNGLLVTDTVRRRAPTTEAWRNHKELKGRLRKAYPHHAVNQVIASPLATYLVLRRWKNDDFDDFEFADFREDHTPKWLVLAVEDGYYSTVDIGQQMIRDALGGQSVQVDRGLERQFTSPEQPNIYYKHNGGIVRHQLGTPSPRVVVSERKLKNMPTRFALDEDGKLLWTVAPALDGRGDEVSAWRTDTKENCRAVRISMRPDPHVPVYLRSPAVSQDGTAVAVPHISERRVEVYRTALQ